MFHRSVSATTSEIAACMWSPGCTLMPEIVSDGTGTSSHQAEYEAVPFAATSCSVPVWIRVLSPTVQFASIQPPPIPIQSDDDSACPAACCVAVGTVQSPVIELNSLLPCSSVPWLYPNQLLLCAALMPTPGLVMCNSLPWVRAAAWALVARPISRPPHASAVTSTRARLNFHSMKSSYGDRAGPGAPSHSVPARKWVHTHLRQVFDQRTPPCLSQSEPDRLGNTPQARSTATFRSARGSSTSSPRHGGSAPCSRARRWWTAATRSCCTSTVTCRSTTSRRTRSAPISSRALTTTRAVRGRARRRTG